VESGGGDNDVLPLAVPLAPLPGGEGGPARVPRTPSQPEDSGNDPVGAIPWRRACTDYFAAEVTARVRFDEDGSPSPAPRDEATPAASLAAVAGLAVVLSGYGRAPAEERQKGWHWLGL
jgi:hypothetical protein